MSNAGAPATYPANGPTNCASGAKKKPQERITIGRPANTRITPVVVMPRL
jgi:hypothetical protein